MSDKNDQWMIAEGIHDELPLIIRCKIEGNSNTLNVNPHLIRISWKFVYETEKGLPCNEENLSLDSFENLLLMNIEEAKIALLLIVITNNGVRDFYFYAKNVQEFIDKFHVMPQEEKPYPVRIEVTSDEFGEFYRGIMNSCS